MLIQEEIPKNLRCKIELIRGKRFRKVVAEVGFEEFRNIMKYLYSSLGMGTVSIGKMVGRSNVTIAEWLGRLGIPVKPHKYRSYARLARKHYVRVELKKQRKVKTDAIVPDEDLVRLIFFTIGDGSTQDYLMCVHQTEKQMFPTLYGRMMRYGTVFVDYYDSHGGKVDTLEKAYIYRLTLNNAKLARLIADEQGLRLDTTMFCLEDSELAHYAIASFWDADGSFPKDRTKLLGFRAEITQSNIPKAGRDATRLLGQVKKALKTHWGINSRLRLLPVEAVKSKERKPIEPRHRRYILHINQEDLPKFADFVGRFCEHPYKRERSLGIIERGKSLGLLYGQSLENRQSILKEGP
jgi:hypothetical protein